MKLSNQQRDKRLLGLLKYAGVPAGLIVAIAAAADGQGYILFMAISLGLMHLGTKVLFNSRHYKLSLERNRNGVFPLFRYVYGFLIVTWALFSLAAGFTAIWFLGSV